MDDFIKIPVICVEAMLALADAERGRLLKSVLEYCTGRSVTEPCGSERGLYLVLKSQIDLDLAEEAEKRSKERDRKRKARSSLSAGQDGTEWDMTGQSWTKRDTPHSPSSSPPIPPLSSPSLPPKEKPPKGGKKKAPFSPPTLDEVRAYCIERKNGIDPEAFLAHYQANGWVQGKTCKPIVDWKACVITWERTRKAQSVQEGEKRPARRFKTVEIDGRLVDVEVGS